MSLYKPGLFILLLLGVFNLSAQERCGIVAYEKIRNLHNPKLETTEEFEDWMQRKLSVPRLKAFGTKKTGAPTYTIPVVVHVIHNGEPVGTGLNISDDQINSQIEVLNKDFQRLNGDASQTPAEFQSVAGSLDIEFVLARQDPEGLATNGINRVPGTKTEWTMADDAQFKALSYWPAENYLNIWIIKLSDGGLVGYAQLPVSTLLGGLESSSNNRLTDGIVVDYQAFGSSDGIGGPFNLDPQFNKGRTATHEIGHFFGLRHIWGDDSGSCSDGGHFTDYVEDTPNQDNSTSNCPVHPQPTCGVNKMFQNYLDYTNDVCMNLFTTGQIDRMTIVLENSPRRVSLLTSPGATPPVVVANDLGIKSIAAPGTSACPGSNIPSVMVRNYGTDIITSARIQIKLNSIIAETKDFSFNITQLGEVVLSFNTINLAAASNNQISFEILLVNGVTDDKASNNLLSTSTSVPLQTTLPLLEVFNTVPTNWTLQNQDGQKTWENLDVTLGGISNRAVYLNFFDYENEGAVDRLVTPVFDLSTTTSATLKFDRAYARYPGVDTDKLRVLVLTDCGANILQAFEVFNKAGSALSTTTDKTGSFKPTSATQWATEIISLSSFIGMSNIRIAFETTNGYGNNLYLDNALILSDETIDLAITRVDSPSPVLCITNPAPVIRVRNVGSLAIASFIITSTVNSTTQTQSFTDQALLPGEERVFTLNALTLKTGSNSIQFAIAELNGLPDLNPENNVIDLKCVVNNVQEGIPLREKFEADFSTGWTIISQGNEKLWELSSTNNGNSLSYAAFTNTNKGEEAWLVSPVLDLSRTQKASLFFDVSYGKSNQGNERLKVLASGDCGNNFTTTSFDLPGDQFSSDNSNLAWSPLADADWKNQYINLDNMIGIANARFAFIVTNDNGNNLYLDNIEFYIDDNPYPPQINSLVSVYASPESFSHYKISFNLPEKVPAYLQVYNLMGQVVIDNILPETLNQTYTVDLSEQSAGLYIVRLQVANEFFSTKIFVGR